MVWSRVGWVAVVLAEMALGQAKTPARPELFVQVGAPAYVTMGSTAFAPDGSWYVTGDGNTWQIWSVALKSELRRMSPIPPQIVSRLSIAADSRTILALEGSVMTSPVFSGGNVTPSTLTTKLALVNAATGVVERELTLPDAPAMAIGSPTEMVVASMDTYATQVEVRSLADGKVLWSGAAASKRPATTVLTNARLMFSPDGKVLIAANPEHVVGWEWKTGRKVLDYDAYAAYAKDLNRQVPVNYRNKSVSTAREEAYADVLGAEMSPDGREVVACAKDQAVLFARDESGGMFRARKAAAAPADRLLSGCGFVFQNRYFLTTYDPKTNLNMATVMVDRKSGAAATVQAEINGAFAIPKSDLWLLRVGGQVALINEAGVTFPAATPPVTSFHPSFTAGDAKLLWRAAQDHPLAWDLASGEADLVRGMNVTGYSLAPSFDGTRVAFEEPVSGRLQSHIAVADSGSGRVVARFPNDTVISMYQPSLNRDGSVVAMLASDEKLEVHRVPDGAVVYTQAVAKKDLQNLHTALNPAGTMLAVSTPAQVRVVDLASGKTVASWEYAPDNGVTFDVMVQFSPDGAWLALARQGGAMRLISTKNWKDEKKLGQVYQADFTFAPDGKRIVYAEQGELPTEPNEISFKAPGVRLVVDDVATGKHLGAIPGALFSNMTGPAFSADGKLIAVETGTGMELVNAANGQVLATLYIFSGAGSYDWLVVTPNGLFDGTPAAWQRVSWRFNGDTFDVAPVESFFREFYHPGLLTEVMAGKTPAAPADIATVDRRQPMVAITSSAGDKEVSEAHVHVSLAVAESRAKVAGDKAGSGARDVRLFRDGTLVKLWRGPLKLDKDGTAKIETDVPIAAGQHTLTAYAFNDANIKSADASLQVTGADSLQRKGTAYVVAIGLNKYAADKPTQPLNLRFAEADANDFAATFAASQKRLEEFGDVKTVALLSEDATRANILAALKVLGGAKVTLTPEQTKLLSPLASVRPEDGVFLFYAGHGAAEGAHFYLLPHDYQPSVDLAKDGSGALSEVALSELLEDISPARSFLVIDACQSGKALDTNGVAVGPMNSTGLAQVAYEKGLDILAASQSLEAALETTKFGHGYLTYALVDEGIKTREAAQDGVVELRPWFEYAGRRVPELQGATPAKDATVDARSMGRKDAVRTQNVQHPRVFFRREPESSPFVVAKPSGRAVAAGATGGR